MRYSKDECPSSASLRRYRSIGSLGKALDVYLETMSVTKTIRQLGLQVSSVGFYKWIKKTVLPVQEVKKPTLETKLNAAYRCFSFGECVQSVSREKRLFQHEHRVHNNLEKEDELCSAVNGIFFANSEMYGYRRIRARHEEARPQRQAQK